MVKLGQLYHCVTQSTVTLSSSPFPELPETLVWGACKDLGGGCCFTLQYRVGGDMGTLNCAA